jgi:hypothetical protein
LADGVQQAAANPLGRTVLQSCISEGIPDLLITKTPESLMLVKPESPKRQRRRLPTHIIDGFLQDASAQVVVTEQPHVAVACRLDVDSVYTGTD